MNRLKSSALMFGIGCGGYPLLELLFRGFTHWTMALAGGVSCVCIHNINARCRSLELWKRALMGAFAICGVELVTGCIVNLRLGLDVWDYSHHPLNIKGQICPIFFGLWYALCLPVMGIEGRVMKKLTPPA